MKFFSIRRRKDDLTVFSGLTRAQLVEKLEWLEKNGFNLNAYYVFSRGHDL